MYGRGTTSSLVSIGKVNKTFKETELQQEENTTKETFALFKLQMLRQAKDRKGFDQTLGKSGNVHNAFSMLKLMVIAF